MDYSCNVAELFYNTPEPKLNDLKRAKKACSFQYGYRKCVTHARVFFRTIEYESNKVEKNKEVEDEVKQKREKMETEQRGKRKKCRRSN